MTEKVKQHAAPVTGSDEIDIGRLVGTVIEARWWVIGITAVFALCAVVYTFFATPIYSADALVQIEQNSGNSLVQDIGSALANKPPASDAEIQLIRSRLVLGKTVDDLDLDIAVSKNTFPIFGAGWERLMGRQNETVKVTTFNRPKEMAQIILTGGSSIMESISKYLIYSNSYVLNFIKFGGKRTTALYFEPAFFALALISIWLSIKQFGIKTPKTDAMILAGIILSGSFSGVMTFILFYLLEWAFQYLNKEAIKKKLPLALISLAVFRVGVVIAFPYISTRLGDLGTEGSSSYYRIVGPLVMVGYSLTHIDGVVRFGSLYEYVASFGIFNGADVGKTIDNGLYLLIIYFSWFAVFLSLWYMGKVIKMMINAFGDNRNFRVQLYLFTPVSLFFTGSIFSPEYAFLIVCPFILRKALNITR